MQVHTNIEWLSNINNPIVTIGTFDGVHAGHRAIIERIINIAKQKNGESVLVTFEPHPRFLINPQHNLKLLNTLEEKKELLAHLGIDHLIISPFTRAFSELSAKEYVEDFLINKIKPRVLVIGYDHHFGKDRSGNLLLLEKYAQQGYFELEEISKQLVDEAHVSSTAIRSAIEKGDVANGNFLLKSAYQLNGIIVAGDKLGRTLGFPTANLHLTDMHKLIPANGVYAIKASLGDDEFNGVMNIGFRPSITNEKELRLEVHLFEFDKDIYNQALKVNFIDRIRDEQKFETIEALKNQIIADIMNAHKILA